MFTCLYLLGSTHATAHRQSRVAATHALPFSPMCRGIFTLGHQAAGRCDDIRRARISDIIKPFKVSGVGPAQCDMVMLMINGGKANKSGKPEYMGLVRHKDVECCGINALVELLFVQYTLEKAPMPKIGSLHWSVHVTTSPLA